MAGMCPSIKESMPRYTPQLDLSRAHGSYWPLWQTHRTVQKEYNSSTIPALQLLTLETEYYSYFSSPPCFVIMLSAGCGYKLFMLICDMH